MSTWHMFFRFAFNFSTIVNRLDTPDGKFQVEFQVTWIHAPNRNPSIQKWSHPQLYKKKSGPPSDPAGRRFHIEEKLGFSKVGRLPTLGSYNEHQWGAGGIFPRWTFHFPQLLVMGPKLYIQLTYSWIDQGVEDWKLLASGYWNLLV